jgi:hypothetical protein
MPAIVVDKLDVARDECLPPISEGHEGEPENTRQ